MYNPNAIRTDPMHRSGSRKRKNDRLTAATEKETGILAICFDPEGRVLWFFSRCSDPEGRVQQPIIRKLKGSNKKRPPSSLRTASETNEAISGVTPSEPDKACSCYPLLQLPLGHTTGERYPPAFSRRPDDLRRIPVTAQDNALFCCRRPIRQ